MLAQAESAQQLATVVAGPLGGVILLVVVAVYLYRQVERLRRERDAARQALHDEQVRGYRRAIEWSSRARRATSAGSTRSLTRAEAEAIADGDAKAMHPSDLATEASRRYREVERALETGRWDRV